jgi:Putative auto-transporter adhesin, head GIN domain
MKQLVLSALMLVAAAPALAAERSFPVGAFQMVSASGAEDITIATGKAVSVVASGPERDLDRLDIRVEDNTLKIGHKKGNWSSWSDDDVKIRVTMPALHGLRMSGSGDIVADSGSGPAFSISSAGSGDARVDRINSPAVRLATSGSGDVTATGRCTTIDVSVSGSSNINAAGLQCADAEVKISGSGDVKVHATAKANIRISGSGDVVVSGGARCQSRSSGSGDVTCP